MFKPRKVNLETKYDVLSLEKQRADILSNFDFKTTAMIMASPCKPVWDAEYEHILGYEPWKMWLRDNVYRVPNEGELRYIAADLLDHVIKVSRSGGNIYTIATGPFKAIYRYGILELDFIMETWSED